MKLHIITVGQPKLAYAKAGWQDYHARLKHYHQVRVTHIPDKHNDAAHFMQAAGTSYKIALTIDGQAFSTTQLAAFLEKRAIAGQEVSFLIGGPEGLPDSVKQAADYHWRLSQLTFPHDLAMLILVEALYRASTVNAGQPYHK